MLVIAFYHNTQLGFNDAGEWVNEMALKNASKYDYQRFGAAQLDVYGKATFGWSYWSLKNVNIHWDLEWMIKNGYMTL